MKTEAFLKFRIVSKWLTITLGICLFVALFGIPFPARAQNDKLETEQGFASAVAEYDLDVRSAILITSQHYTLLDQLQKNREQSQASFHSLVSSYGKRKQGWFYELSRYPETLHALATKESGASQNEINAMLPTQEKEMQSGAWHLYKHHNDDLKETDNLYIAANQNFEKTISGVDDDTKKAFRLLANHPDVLLLLTDNIELAQSLAIKASTDPSVATQLATKHDSLVLQNQKAIAEYKKQMEANPDANNELNKAGKNFAQSSGYILPHGQVMQTNYFNNPYSYWFGYPYWYSYPMWYPGAYWGMFGMTYGIGGMGFYGFPGFGFSTWFFHGGAYYRYPGLYRQYGYLYRRTAFNPLYHVAGRGNFYAPHSFFNVAHEHFSPGYSGGRPVVGGRGMNTSSFSGPGGNHAFYGGRMLNNGSYNVGNGGRSNFGGVRGVNFGGSGGVGFRGGFGGGGGFHGGGRGR